MTVKTPMPWFNYFLLRSGKLRLWRRSLGVLLACLASVTHFPLRSFADAAGAPIAVGQVVPNIPLKDMRYLPRKLSEYIVGPHAVFVFACAQDPNSDAALKETDRLEGTLRALGVQVVGVNPCDSETIRQVALQGWRLDLSFPLLKDSEGNLARTLGITNLPAAVVVDADRTLRYRGDVFRLSDVLAQLRRGDAVADPDTPAGVISIHEKTPLPNSGTLTWAEHIAPILYDNCIRCHSPGRSAPFSLLTYADAVSHAQMIAEVVEEERMPPWYAVEFAVPFTNKPRITQEQRDQLAAWARGARQPGDLTRAPEPPLINNSHWEIGEPDLIVQAAEVEKIPATGFIPYRFVDLPYVFPEDTWVQSLELMPQNRRVVHHALLSIKRPGEERDPDRDTLIATAPGMPPVTLPEGTALKIPKGAQLSLILHYVTTGKEEEDRISAGLRFPRTPVVRQARYMIFEQTTFSIPPGEPHHREAVMRLMPQDVIPLIFILHTHLRGKDMAMFAEYPDGKSETLIALPNYDFYWQLYYWLEPGVRIFPKHTRVRVVAHYDNSRFNAYNPDHTSWVTWGPQTHEEMLEAVMIYAHADENLHIEVDPTTGVGKSGVPMTAETPK
jgi:peroxiredoxin